MQRPALSNLLIVAGALLMAWPLLAWTFGVYSQARLAQSFAARRPMAATRRAHRIAVTMSPHTRPHAIYVHMPARIAYEGAHPTSSESGAAWTDPQAFARLRIDRIGLNAMVVEGADLLSLQEGPGHLPETGLPGDYGNCAIAAHRDTWFRRLPELQIGDPIRVEMPNQTYTYTVWKKRVVDPNRTDLLDQGPSPVLTLITCTGPGYPHSRYRLLVFCRLQGSASS